MAKSSAAVETMNARSDPRSRTSTSASDTMQACCASSRSIPRMPHCEDVAHQARDSSLLRLLEGPLEILERSGADRWRSAAAR